LPFPRTLPFSVFSVSLWLTPSAAFGLANLGDRRCVNPLVGLLLGDRKLSGSRLRAVQALRKIGSRRAVEPFIACLADPAPEIRAECAAGLKGITGVDFGGDPRKWWEWWEDNDARWAANREE